VGEYSIQVQAAGFQTYTRSGIILQAVTQARVDVTLQVGASAEVVNVTENAEQVNTTSSTLKTVVDRQRVENLPLNGRNPLQLLSLLPGGVPRGPIDQFIATPTFSVNGANQDQINYRLDGGDHMDTWFGSPLSYRIRMRCRSSRFKPIISAPNTGETREQWWTPWSAPAPISCMVPFLNISATTYWTPGLSSQTGGLVSTVTSLAQPLAGLSSYHGSITAATAPFGSSPGKRHARSVHPA
jgi:hypothetical protein